MGIPSVSGKEISGHECSTSRNPSSVLFRAFMKYLGVFIDFDIRLGVLNSTTICMVEMWHR